MRKEKIYLIEIHSGGSWEHFSYVEFATKDKIYAENWVKKFNKMVDKWGKYFDNLMKNEEDFIMKSDWAFDRYEIFMDLNGASIRETELR